MSSQPSTLHQFMDRYPEVASELDTLAQLRAGHVDRITANLRSKIRMLATEPDEYSNWGKMTAANSPTSATRWKS